MNLMTIIDSQVVAGVWSISTVFVPANDLLVTHVLDTQSEEGVNAHIVSEANFLAATPRHVGGSFSEVQNESIIVVVYKIDETRVDELKVMSKQDAFDSGILKESLGIARLG